MPGTESGANKYYQVSTTHQKREIFTLLSKNSKSCVILHQKDFILVSFSSINPVI